MSNSLVLKVLPFSYHCSNYNPYIHVIPFLCFFFLLYCLNRLWSPLWGKINIEFFLHFLKKRWKHLSQLFTTANNLNFLSFLRVFHNSPQMILWVFSFLFLLKAFCFTCTYIHMDETKRPNFEVTFVHPVKLQYEYVFSKMSGLAIYSVNWPSD